MAVVVGVAVGDGVVVAEVVAKSLVVVVVPIGGDFVAVFVLEVAQVVVELVVGEVVAIVAVVVVALIEGEFVAVVVAEVVEVTVGVVVGVVDSYQRKWLFEWMWI